MIIRPFNANDGDVYHSWYHDERLREYFREYVVGCSREQAAMAPQMLKAYIHVAEDSAGDVCGLTSLADSSKILRIFKLGVLVDTEFQVQGVGRQLLTHAIKWAFDTMAAHKIFTEILSKEERLHKCLQQSGFLIEGVKRSSMFLDGEFHDETVYSLLRPEYNNHKERGLYDVPETTAA